MSALSGVTDLDVIRECDALEAKMLLVTDGKRPRALALAALTQSLWGLAEPDERAMRDAVVMLLQERLVVACDDELWEQPIPYALVAGAVG